VTNKISLALAALLTGLVVFMAVIAVGCVDEDKQDWKKADTANTVEAFEDYLLAHPDGKYAVQAGERIDDLDWQEAQAADKVGALEGYLQGHSDGRHAVQARERIEELNWRQAQAANTIAAYRQYVASYPAGRFVPQAEETIASLINDESPFLAAQEVGTREAYEGFLAKFPGHVREADARRALDDILQDMEGRQIVDLIAQKKVEARAKGSGIEEVEIELCRLVKHELSVLVPAGTFFVSRGSAQDMVTTNDEEFTLEKEECISVTVPVACADLDRLVPRSDDTFDILPSSQQEEMQKLAPLLREASSEVRQAAVWIVTDNADYDALGTLVSGLGGFGPRVIKEDEAARAMKLVDEAGIDITQKAIWWDRYQILEGLYDEALINWLQQRAG
jgi:hypothetical protein